MPPILLILLSLITQLPYPISAPIFKGLARSILFFLPQRKQVIKTNLNLCFPQASEKQRVQWSRDSIDCLGLGALDTLRAWRTPSSTLRQWVQTEGLEDIIAASQRGGVLLLSAHYNSGELCLKALADELPTVIIQRKMDNPRWNQYSIKQRQKYAKDVLLKGNALNRVSQELRGGNTVGLLIDQFGGRRAEIAPFFSIPTPTMTFPTFLAQRTGCAVFFSSAIRVHSQQYHIQFQDITAIYQQGSPQDHATLVNDLIEKSVKKQPADYFWVHQRFKPQDHNSKNPYHRH